MAPFLKSRSPYLANPYSHLLQSVREFACEQFMSLQGLRVCGLRYAVQISRVGAPGCFNALSYMSLRSAAILYRGGDTRTAAEGCLTC